MTQLELLVDFYLPADRQGPGSTQETLKAWNLLGIPAEAPIRMADIGCGTGASAIALAQHTKAHITAVDIFPAFLRKVQQQARQLGLQERIEVLQASMDDLPFAPESLDVIWSEGAIYNMGFEKGIAYWRQFLKPGGYLAVSELSWTTRERPGELQDFWEKAYPEVDTVANKIQLLMDEGYRLVGYFELPAYCWEVQFYLGLQEGFEDFLRRHEHSEAAQAVVDEMREEMGLYERHKAHYGYGFYLAQKL